MSGNNRAILIFSAAALALYAMLTFMGAPWCTPVIAAVLGLSAGNVGANMQKADPSKTARIARTGAKVGGIAGFFGLIGQLVGGWLAYNSAANAVPDSFAPSVTLWLCIGVVGVAVFAFFGWVGGWSWARHEHERQTGYKPT